MKLLTRLTVACSIAVSSLVWADIGPYYVSYTGYCNVKRVYVNNYGDIYGTEINCSSSCGEPVMGTLTAYGNILVSEKSGSAVCLDAYSPDGSLNGGCTSGGSIRYIATQRYTVAETADPQPTIRYSYSSEMPNLEALKGLPELPR